MNQDPSQYPKYRAAVTAERLAINFWHPGLTALPVLAQVMQMRQADVDYADLQIVGSEGEREIIASFAGNGPGPDARRRFVDWAGRVGYTRLWLADELIDLADSFADVSEAYVDCPTCGARISCLGPTFWEQVRRLGHFPRGCGYCGGVLPEWRLVEDCSSRAEPRP